MIEFLVVGNQLSAAVETEPATSARRAPRMVGPGSLHGARTLAARDWPWLPPR
ncbi:MAG TPA: hypothetical protein VFC03_19055 [Acidimicrobiales bacterium]|nr:hypothetical protein [Acidimicrobiales bacterium]